jgi:hypothetical protein
VVLFPFHVFWVSTTVPNPEARNGYFHICIPTGLGKMGGLYKYVLII